MIDIKQSATKLLEDLNLADLQNDERQQVLSQLEDHFNTVILDTLLAQLSTEQFDQLKQSLNSPNFEAEVASLAATVPGLAEALELRVAEEYKILKAAMEGEN